MSRSWCHLCDDLLAGLAPIAARFGVPVDVIDVDSDPALEAAHGERVPVLFAGEIELCHYHLDADRVVAELDAYRARVPDAAADAEVGQRRPDFG
ncbi:glutaredoxin family protein [Pararobbsia silviterrae]|uniref:glutaredoxin family protein n=1 Tax=Pararobbsia silviterrae TaxID=1792498 RepID=UPI003B830E50